MLLPRAPKQNQYDVVFNRWIVGGSALQGAVTVTAPPNKIILYVYVRQFAEEHYFRFRFLVTRCCRIMVITIAA